MRGRFGKVAGFGALGQGGILYSTEFAATENPISEGGIWQLGLADGTDWQNIRTTGGLAIGSTINAGGAGSGGPFDDNLAHIKAGSIQFPADQWVQTVLSVTGGYAPGVSHEWEHLLRFAITTDDARGYEVLHSLNLAIIEIVRWNGARDDFTSLATIDINALIGRTFIDGDVVTSGIRGSVISAYLNGVLVGTATNATHTSGQPGVGVWARSGATLASFGGKSSVFGAY